MRKITKKQIIILSIIVIILSIFVMPRIINPLRRTDVGVRKYILSKTPLGTTYEEVEKTIEQRGWNNVKISEQKEHGFYDPNLRVGRRSDYIKNPEYKEIGSMMQRASLGDYWGLPCTPFMANVTAYWGFDENGELIDVRIWRTCDSL